jgi:hypothetical protein
MVSWMLYISLTQEGPQPRRLTEGGAQPQRRRPMESASNNINHDTGSSNFGSSSSARALLTRCQVLPPHVDRSSLPDVARDYPSSSATSSRVSSPPNSSREDNHMLVDGIVAFRHTKAAATVGKADPDPATSSARNATIMRKERALLLSRLLSNANESACSSPVKNPPKVVRGSILVAAIPVDDVVCGKLRHILYLLATYFNVFILIHTPSNTRQQQQGSSSSNSSNMTMSQVLQQRDGIIHQLRKTFSSTVLPIKSDGNDDSDSSCCLSDAILPAHRILVTTSAAGRIAFCRQLDSQRVQLVMDFDSSVKTELNRFGYRRVYFYSQSNVSGEATSGLAKALEWQEVKKSERRTS